VEIRGRNNQSYNCTNLITNSINSYTESGAGGDFVYRYDNPTGSMGVTYDGQAITSTQGYEMSKLTATPSVPGAGSCQLFAEAGTNSGSCKLAAMCGTSGGVVTVQDNIGSGC
jgi:hypothetical protein